jgi:aspartate aminotransferase
MRIHASFQNVGLSRIVQVSERARALAPEFESRTGEPFIYFQRGEVGYPAPAFLADALAEAVQKGWTKYPRSGGEGFFKDAVLADLAARGIAGLGPENLVATLGGQEGLELVFAACRGGRCAGFTPAWSCLFDNIFPYTETTFVPVPLLSDRGWAIDWRALEAVLPSVETFYFNSPHNPTGRVFQRADVERLCLMCEEHGVVLVCDEAYRDLAYEGEHYSPLADERWSNVLSVNTFSKALAATGFRIGFTASRRAEWIELLTRGEYTQTAGPPTPIQYAVSRALAHPGYAAWLRAYRAEMVLRARTLAQTLDARLGANPPQGAFYCFIDAAPRGGGTPDPAAAEADMVERLMQNGVAVVPGSAFGAQFTGWVRLSFSTLSPDLIRAGAARFNRVLLGQHAAGPA